MQLTSKPKIKPLFQIDECEDEDFVDGVADVLAWDLLVGLVVVALGMELMVEVGEATSSTAGTVTVAMNTPLAV